MTKLVLLAAAILLSWSPPVAAQTDRFDLKEWPVVLLGTLGGRLRSPGRYLHYPRYQSRGHRTMSNLYLSLLQAAGDVRDSFGLRDPGLKDVEEPGALPELF